MPESREQDRAPRDRRACPAESARCFAELRATTSNAFLGRGGRARESRRRSTCPRRSDTRSTRDVNLRTPAQAVDRQAGRGWCLGREAVAEPPVASRETELLARLTPRSRRRAAGWGTRPGGGDARFYAQARRPRAGRASGDGTDGGRGGPSGEHRGRLRGRTSGPIPWPSTNRASTPQEAPEPRFCWK